ncbi:MAG: HEAT repeat domain-containing protein [Mariniblastus sp.]|nr:HEAT repeat domain-containing protein [Mariniblastus sp.]
MVSFRFAVSIPVLVALLVLPVFLTAQQPLPAEGDESQLIAILDSDAPLFDKAKACQRLAIIGTPKSVPAVAKLLADPELSHYARFALEANPSPKVDTVFRQALGELKGPQLVGVINSVGSRGDIKAIDALSGLAVGQDDEVASAAVSGLGALATAESIRPVKQALSGKRSLRLAAADACLTAADRLLEDGKNAEALEILALLRQADLPRHINVASRLGEIRSGTQDENDLMVSYLSDTDPDLFRIGLELAHHQRDAETTAQLLKQLEALPMQRQVLLVHVLGDRGEVSALPALADLADSDDEGMKLAAVRVLGSLGDGSVLPVLLRAALSDNQPMATISRDSLAQLAGPEVDEQLVNRLKNSDGQERLVLVDVAGRRGIKRAIPLLLQFVSSEDAELRNLAIDGLGRTVGLEDFPQMVDQLLAAGSSPSAPPMKEALRKACQRMGDRAAASRVLLERMATATEQAQTDLMDLLVYVGGPQALAGAQAAAQGEDRSVANAATQALGKWLTPDVAPVLLELAQSGNAAYRVRCLRGYIRVIRQFGLRPGQRLQMSKKAFAVASRDEERKLVLDTLTRFPLPQGLKMVTLHLENSSLSDAASQAAVVIGEKIVNNDPKSVASAMKRVVAVSGDEELVERAKLLIARTKQKTP